MEAAVILAKCPKKNKTYGITTEKKEDGDWWRVWAFPIEERRARNEGFDKTIVQGNLRSTDKYPGCPHCGAKGFVQCNSCHKIACWNGETQMKCPWCGTNMDKITPATEKFNLFGGDF